MKGSLEAWGVRAPLSGGPYSAVELSDDGRTVVLLDQLRLPRQEAYLGYESAPGVAEAIRSMVVRGAPAIGLAAAYGVTLAARTEAGEGAFLDEVRAAGRALAAARPTAVNLPWAVNHMLRRAEAVAALPANARHAALVLEARSLHAADVAACRAMGRSGAALLPEGAVCLTHCNAGALATGGYGTALGVVRAAWAAGTLRRVLADETRPYLQGARLTAWELSRDGIDVELITDGMAGHLMARGEVGAVVVGADRVARNGDVANKVGTYGLAVLARAHSLPFFVVAPWSTVDMDCPDGAAIPIEERSSDEVTAFAGTPVAPAGVRARHPAFDVTPAGLVTALITERGVARPVGLEALRRLGDETGGKSTPPGLHSGVMANERRERDELRQQREQIDRDILALLRRRARLSRQVAARATAPLRPTLPSTERDTLEALARDGGDDLPSPAIVGVFRQIHAVCRSLEAPVRATYVGAEGCRAYVVAFERFGPLAELVPSETVPAALESVDRGRADFAVLPYETSAEGLDHASLAALAATELKIVALHDVTTPLALLAQGVDLAAIERVFATAVDRASAQHNLSVLLPRAAVIDVKTSLAACSQALEDPSAAALALEALGHRTGLAVASRSVADVGEGRQRFCVVTARPASRTGRDGTTITFAVSDQPGQLFEVLKPFAERGVNVRTIQSRPPARDEQDTMFYIEVSGHATDRAVVTALENVKNQTRTFKVLGSYPVP